MPLILSALFAEIVGTIAGFGSSTIFMPLALLFFAPSSALIITTIFHIFGSLMQIIYFRRAVNSKLVIKFALPSILASIIGALVTPYLPQDIFKIIISFSLISFALYALTGHQIKLKPNSKTITLGGLVSGLAAGLAGTGGAVRASTLMAFNLSKNTYLGSIAAIALISDLARLPVYIYNGFLNDLNPLLIPVLGITSICGALIGETIVNFIPQKQFRKLVLSTVIILSGVFAYDSLRHLGISLTIFSP